MNQSSLLFRLCLQLVGCCFLLSCSSKDADGVIVDSDFTVVDTATQDAPNYRIIYFPSDGMQARQLQQMQQSSGFQLQLRERDIEGFVFLEVMQADALDAGELQHGLDSINALSFINNARFETLMQSTSEY